MANKHQALATELEKDIMAGKYGWEGGLPSGGELAQIHNLSINTVKSALALLEGKGIIEKRGIAYYVNTMPTMMTQYVPPAHARAKRGGFVSNVGSVKQIALPDYLEAKCPGLTRTEPVIFRVQISGEIVEGSEKPIQITRRYYLLEISDDDMKRMQDDATFDPMWDNPNQQGELTSHDEVTARLATSGECDLLALPEETPIANIFESIRGEQGVYLMLQEIVLSPRVALIFDFPFTNRP